MLLNKFAPHGSDEDSAISPCQAKETGDPLMQMMSRLAHVGAWDVDLQANRMIWSDEVCRIHGVPPGSIVSIEEGIRFYAAEHRKRIEEVFYACMENGVSYDEELEIIAADGHRRWVRTIGQAVRDDAGAIIRVQGAFQDISEKKAAEYELFRSRQRFQQFTNAMPIIVWTADPDGTVDYVNDVFRKYGSSDGTELPVERWLQAVHEEDQERCLAAWQESIRSGRKYSVEFRVRRRRDGAARWHLVKAVPIRGEDGSLIKWYGTAVDIHSRKRSEKLVTRLAERLQTILESITDAFVTLDHRWRFTYVNRHAETVLRRPRADILHKNIWTEFPVLAETSIEGRLRRAVDDDRTVEFEEHISSLDTWLQITAYPSSQGLAIYFRDITDRKRIESERDRLEDQLRQVQRLDALGRLTGGVAHDFNNLLTVILGAADLLVESLDPEAQPGELAAMIKGAAQRGASVTHRLLAFGRQQALRPCSIDVKEVINGIEGLLKRTLGENIVIEVINSAGLWPSFADKCELESAILNICINARDAMNGRGRITIEAINTLIREGQFVDEEVSPGKYVKISVTDTGPGIPEQIIARVFDPFFTTKEKGKGTGLGLSMVYGFAKQSKGHVTVQSKPGTGTSITLFLPCAKGVETDRLQPAAKETDFSNLLGFEKILVVEDDAAVRRYASEALRQLGYFIVEAANGREALEILRRTPDFDLLLTDVVMPGGMNGRELLEEARRIHSGLPVLFASGYPDSTIMQDERSLPDTGVLRKPFHKADLALRVREALRNPGDTRGIERRRK